MIQSNNTNTTRKQGSCYRDSSLGKLSRTNLGRVSFSLQKEITDILRGISISIDFKPTGLAFVQPIITTFNFIQNSASATELRSMIWVNSNNINLLLNSDNVQGTSKFEIRDFIDNSINFSAFGISEFSSSSQEFQIFNNNMRNIELISKFNNLIVNLEQSCPDKIVFKSFNVSKTSQSPITESLVVDTSQVIFSKINLSSFVENILPEIELSQDFFVPIHNCQCEISRININSHDIALLHTDKTFFNTNLQEPFNSFNEPTRFENPTIRNMTFKSLEQSIFSNRQNNPLTFYNPRQSKERSFPFSLSISKHLGTKINRQSFDFFTDFSPIPNQTSSTNNCICSQQIKFIPTFFVSGVM